LTAEPLQIRNFIDGRFVEPVGGKYVDNIEPATGKPYSQVPQDELIPDSSSSAHTQIRAQIPGALGRDLSQVVAAWAELPSPLKAAILAIVNSSTASMEGES